MKYLLIIFLTLISFVGFTQSPTKIVKDSIDILVPLDRPVKNSDLRKTLKQIADLKQILGVEPVANPNPNFVEKGDNSSYPYGNIGGIPTAFKFRVWKFKNATSYDFVVSKNSDLSNPTNSFNSTSTNAQITGLDSNSVYYWKYRGKNANFTGAWSDIKRFDTCKLTAFGTPFYDLVQYDPIVFKDDLECLLCMNIGGNSLKENVEYETLFRINDKKVFGKLIHVTVNSFPFTMITGVSSIVKIENFLTGIVTFPSWTNKQQEYNDFKSAIVLTGTNVNLNFPSGFIYPIQSIDFYAGIYYTK